MFRRVLLFTPLLLAFADPKPKAPPLVVLAVIECNLTAPTCRAVARWTRGANYTASIDSTRVLWRNAANLTGNPLRRIYTDRTADTLSVPRPAIGAPLGLRLDVCTFRIGFTEAACAAPVMDSLTTNADPPDPPTGVTVTPSSATLRAGDTLRILASPS